MGSMKNKTALERLEAWLNRWETKKWQAALRNAGGTDSEPEYHYAFSIEKMFAGHPFKSKDCRGWELYSGNAAIAHRINGRFETLGKIISDIRMSEVAQAQNMIGAVFFKIDWRNEY